MNLLTILCVVGIYAGQSIAGCPAIASDAAPPAFVEHATLPDPFLTFEGERVKSRSQWDCRRSELSQAFQQLQYGVIPGAPESLNASLDGNVLIIQAQSGDTAISFSVEINMPESGEPPYPAMIHFGGVLMPASDGVADIIYRNLELGQTPQIPDSPVNTGLFYTLHGQTISAGLQASWVWGVSRIIDALELVPESGIDPTRLGVTGCSRDAGAALAAGAFDERIVLTIPREGGEGGDACFRITEAEKASTPYPCGPIMCETRDFGLSRDFAPHRDEPALLPFDQHELAGLIAPRALLVLQNDITYLRPVSSFECMKAAHGVWEALGVPERMGVSMKGGHTHCQFPDDQRELLAAFVDKFLVRDRDVDFDTGVVEYSGPDDIFLRRGWVKWEVPILE